MLPRNTQLRASYRYSAGVCSESATLRTAEPELLTLSLDGVELLYESLLSKTMQYADIVSEGLLIDLPLPEVAARGVAGLIEREEVGGAGRIVAQHRP